MFVWLWLSFELKCVLLCISTSFRPDIKELLLITPKPFIENAVISCLICQNIKHKNKMSEWKEAKTLFYFAKACLFFVFAWIWQRKGRLGWRWISAFWKFAEFYLSLLEAFLRRWTKSEAWRLPAHETLAKIYKSWKREIQIWETSKKHHFEAEKHFLHLAIKSNYINCWMRCKI